MCESSLRIRRGCLAGLATAVLLMPLTEAQTWKTKTPMPTRRSGASAGVLEGKLYVVGGGTEGWSGPHLETVEVYDPVTDSWSLGTPLPPGEGKYDPSVETVDGKLYVIQGYPGYRGIWEYDPETDAWRYASNAYLGGYGFDSFRVHGVIDGKIYVVNTMWGNVYLVDPVTGQWGVINDRYFYARKGQGGVIGKKIYVAGGTKFESHIYGPIIATADVDVYDTETDTWTTAAPMLVPRADAEAAVIDGKLYVIGGVARDSSADPWEPADSMEVYDPASDTWTLEKGTPTVRVLMAAGAIDGELLVAGGQVPESEDPALPPLSTLETFRTRPKGKVCICHFPPSNPMDAETLCIGAKAAEAHLREHGDLMGACPY